MRIEVDGVSLSYRDRGQGEALVYICKGSVPLERFAKDIDELTKAINIPPFALCELSMGGQIALECYRIFPQKITKVVLAVTFAQEETAAGKLSDPSAFATSGHHQSRITQRRR